MLVYASKSQNIKGMVVLQNIHTSNRLLNNVTESTLRFCNYNIIFIELKIYLKNDVLFCFFVKLHLFKK